MPGPEQWSSVVSSRALLVLSVNFRETLYYLRSYLNNSVTDELLKILSCKELEVLNPKIAANYLQLPND